MIQRLISSLAGALLLASCAAPPPAPVAGCPPAQPCPTCPVCPPVEPPKPPEKPLQPAEWSDVSGWQEDNPLPAFEAFRASCNAIESAARGASNQNGFATGDCLLPQARCQPSWNAACIAARSATIASGADARAWFEAQFRPWALVNPDGSRTGLVTGYYEPLLKGSRTRKPPYLSPLFAPPEDMITVELTELFPEFKGLRLRGRIEGRKLVPYYSRAEWAKQEDNRSGGALFWIDDPLDLFFMQVQGSGQVTLDDGSRVRVSYADQNGHPYRSIGKWLVDQGELKLEQASMQSIKAWARANPKRLQELLNANPSLVFFRELPAPKDGAGAMGSGPPGALGVPLTPERSIAVDPRIVTLGAPVFLATSWPNEDRPLNRLMLAQDTGGAIRGAVRADFYWGTGAEAGSLAGRMKQRGSMWVLMPRSWSPK